METYPLCRELSFWHSATENVSAQQYADQGREGTPILHGGGKPASAIGESSAAASVVLGEINDSQQAAWRKTLEVFDEEQDRFTSLSLFPEDRPVPADAIDSVQVKLSEMKLERARPYGNCWLGCELWRQLQLDRFWSEKLPQGRESVAWPQVLELLVVNRLIEPGSEFRVHRHWFDHSAMDVLLGEDFAVAEKDRLYRCLDRVLEHKQELFVHLQQRWKDLFHSEFDLLGALG